MSKEDEPFLTFKLADTEVVAMPSNSKFFHHHPGTVTFEGTEYRTEQFDHLFIAKQEIGRQALRGFFLWRRDFDGDRFDQLLNTGVENGFPAEVNARQVSVGDIRAQLAENEAITERMMGEIPDELPDDFS